jgi:phosphatidate cytidylyltransferase
MALNVATFLKRSGSAVVFVAIMLTGLLWTDWAFIGLFCMINFLCLNEYFKLMEKMNPEGYWPKWLTSSIQAISLLLVFLFSMKPNQLTDDMVWNLGRLLPVIPAITLLAAALAKRSALSAWLQSLGGLLYITVPVVLLIQLRMQNLALPMGLIFMIWSNDTMAYLVGSFFGKHPLSSISPNKTWEGTVGGALITILAAAIFGYFANIDRIRMVDWMALAACATIAGSFGDLLESKLKRMAGVKDSGNIMPGHGGALDRFDSLLIAAPFAYVYVNYFMR